VKGPRFARAVEVSGILYIEQTTTVDNVAVQRRSLFFSARQSEEPRSRQQTAWKEMEQYSYYSVYVRVYSIFLKNRHCSRP